MLSEEELRQKVLKARQRQVAQTGTNWEDYVAGFLKQNFSEMRRGQNKKLIAIIEDIGVLRLSKEAAIHSLQNQYPALYRNLYINRYQNP